jgi:hypothetical protein
MKENIVYAHLLATFQLKGFIAFIAFIGLLDILDLDILD